MLWTIRGAGFALGAGMVVLLAFLGSRAIGVVLLLFLGVLLGAALGPLVTWLRRRLPLSRGLAIGVVYAAFFLLVAGLVLVVVPTALAEAGRVGERLPAVLDSIRGWAATLRPEALGSTISHLADAAETSLLRAARPPDAGQVVEVGLTVAEAVVSVTTLLVVVAFWLVERPRLQRYVLSFVPARRRAGSRTAWNRVERRLGLWARGQLTLMASVGLASGIAYQLLGLPSAVMLGVVAAVCEAIPLVGPLLGAVPAILVAATISPATALAVAAVYVVIHLVEGNILVPIVMRNAVGLSPLLVLLSLVGGAAVGGLVGALIAVPVVAAIEILLAPLQARQVPVAPEPRSEEPPGERPAEAPPAGRASGELPPGRASDAPSGARA